MMLFTGLIASAQSVVVVEDLEKYTGEAPYVYNQKDGKTYVLNNVGAYELYGVFETVNTLTVKSASGTQQVSYLKNPNGAYIDLGYKPKRNTIIETVFQATSGPDFKAVYGTRFQANTQNDKEFPGTENYSPGNGWKHGFAYFSTNAVINLGGETGSDDAKIFGKKILTIQNAVNGDLQIYDADADDEAPAMAIIDDSPLTGDCETSLYIFAINKHLPIIPGYNENPDAFGDNSDPCINTLITLYSMKIYEGDTPIYDLVPVLSDGKGGLLDKISTNVFTSANSADFEVPEETGITAYEGKMVIYQDKVYKYSSTSGEYEFVSDAVWTPIADTKYQDMNNWETNDAHKAIFDGKWQKTEKGYKIDPYEGTGGHEPLMIKVNINEGNTYKFSFTSSWNQYSSWHTTEMHAYVCNFWDLGTQESGLDVSNSVLATQTFSFDGGEDVPFSLDFVADRNDQTLVFQFGDVADGEHDPSFSFEFDDLLVTQRMGKEQYPVLNIYKPRLAKLISEVEEAEFNTTVALQTAVNDAIAKGKAVVDGDDMDAQEEAFVNLQNFYDLAKSVDVTMLKKVVYVVENYDAKRANINTADAKDFIQKGMDRDALNKTLNSLRTARKVAHMEHDDAEYKGNAPAEADFYIYNVGRKAYLTSGSDWGTHAALGYPGLLATLAANGDGYTIQFNELVPAVRDGEQVKSDEARDKFLNGSPYVDGWDANKGTYIFEPVSGKPGVYNIKDSNNGYLAFDPDGEVDGGGIKDFNTVTAFWATPKNEDAEWMLVTKDDRLAQLDNAKADNGVDVSFLIKNASFNKYADLGQWSGINQSNQFGRREFGDKNTEHYHGNEDSPFSLNQEVILPRAGWYLLTVQAYFRDGDINPYIESVMDGTLAPEAGAVLYLGMDETRLKYIHEEADKAPGEGADTQIGNIPDGGDGMYQASKFFENGLYVNSLLVHVDAAELESVIGIDELDNMRAGSWIVADNFRLCYFGDGEEPIVPVPPVTIPGDVNGDGEVNVGDLVSVSNFMAGEAGDITKEAADVNKDGEVNVGDMVTITNIMAGNE